MQIVTDPFRFGFFDVIDRFHEQKTKASRTTVNQLIELNIRANEYVYESLVSDEIYDWYDKFYWFCEKKLNDVLCFRISSRSFELSFLLLRAIGSNENIWLRSPSHLLSRIDKDKLRKLNILAERLFRYVRTRAGEGNESDDQKYVDGKMLEYEKERTVGDKLAHFAGTIEYYSDRWNSYHLKFAEAAWEDLHSRLEELVE